LLFFREALKELEAAEASVLAPLFEALELVDISSTGR